MRIFAEVPRSWRQISVGLSITAIFSVFAGYFFGSYRNKASIIIQRYTVLVGFSVIAKCVALNYLEWLFRVKFCFRAGLSGVRSENFENNCMKTNKDRHILSAAQIFDRKPSLWQYKVCADIRAGSLEKGVLL